jgi:hypothetical protein
MTQKIKESEQKMSHLESKKIINVELKKMQTEGASGEKMH